MEYTLLNLSYLDEYFLGDVIAVRELLNIFTTSVTIDLNNLEVAVLAENRDNVKKGAHKLKSAYRYLGIHSMGEIFEDIEKKSTKSVNFVELKLLFETGLRMNKEVLNEINQFLNQ